MTDDSNRRRSARIKTRFESLYSAGRYEGAGVLSEISFSGARVEGASLKPELGKELRIYVFVQPVCPFEVIGRVVRHTEEGFAIEFDNLSDDVRRLIEDASAMVGLPDASN